MLIVLVSRLGGDVSIARRDLEAVCGEDWLEYVTDEHNRFVRIRTSCRRPADSAPSPVVAMPDWML